MAEISRSRRRRTRRRRVVAVAVGALVLTGGGAVAIATTGKDGPSLRLASVRQGTVTQTVESSGTVTSSQKVTPAFAASATVRSVAVSVGAHVTKGQVLARLDTTALRAAVDSAQAALASAEQRLEGDRSGQLSSASAGSSTGATANKSSAQGASSGGLATAGLTTSSASEAALVTPQAKPGDTPPARAGNLAQLSAEVKKAQAALLAAQHAVDDTQAEIDAAQQSVDTAAAHNVTLRDAQQTSCGSSGSSSTITPACDSAMAAYESSADTLSADVAALGTKITAQDGQVKDVDTAISALDDLIGQLQAAAAASQSTGSGRTTAPSGSSAAKSPTSRTNTSSSTGSNPSASTAQPASATQLAADQAAIDAAAAQLAVAKQNLAAATLTSPIAGRIAAVELTPGASSSGKTITVIGTGVQGVETSVPLAQVDSVKLGQSVTVAADGVKAKLAGRVTSIGLLSTTSGSLTTFPVFVTLTAGSQRLFDGAGADVVIATGSATDVLTVPNSAIHAAGRGRYTVSVASGSKTSARPVTLGVIGRDSSQVKSGLHQGERVVLADLSKSLPSSSTSNSNRSFRFGGAGGTGFVPKFATGGAGGK